ncbi:3-methylcrotonoyl-CoA carboxylase alpha subunit [Rhodovulum bhavnagarense]|uniref:3-methylcrotonoyl-CoA carboxylase alpha subunit n=1 Tax=Rhodovulum bhavnagarense TaxID=992286 RepID=A0A4R2R7R0_9RHOB|nr:biotin carboxylase N-terminal domain-containing protein [Rhodovulum bhavnagarense]TCP58653.1 3-methylcrotonoyl-CoA carboxylase alpha subunit [Rhodovulum bhavnagarense]
MFQKILIANRGEIAVRIIDTARAMGVSTVAVYSEADADAAHVAAADEAVPIGAAPPRESYLCGDRIIAAARATGAQAIHPGYGFLSENPDFVAAVEAAGLIFIGPSAEAIRAMGLKDAAKALMEQAGVPVVPGYHGDNQDDDHLAGAAEAIGYPVLIKAVAGGGGKGMRKVAGAADFPAALQAARSEARNAFGNDAVLIEKYVEQPRHIEVQVFGDGQDAVHLYERDCSLQRRHQKVIEEAPAPGMTPEMRAAMGEAAVRAARAIGYRGAGTVEFIVDGSDGLRPDRFWFMEMNTRLQVEHPVTEAVTGLDLVEWQLRIAAGEGLPLAQEAIPLTGHAFEARLYAEDVAAGFLPATGTLAHLAFPPGIRADTGVRTGDTISPFYDPMIAKIVVAGATRGVALNRLARALEETRVAGTVTNLGFLGRLARHPGFAIGDVDTGLIARDLAELADGVPEPALLRAVVASAALVAAGLSGAALEGFALWQPLSRDLVLACEGEQFCVQLRLHGPDRATLVLEGGEVHAIRHPEGWIVDGHRPLPVVKAGGAIYVFAGAGGTFGLVPVDPLARATAEGLGGDGIEAPMPGLVKVVYVAAGVGVTAGQPLVILEAMKMEHTLTAPRDGIVAELFVAEGDQVEAGAPLIRLETEEDIA